MRYSNVVLALVATLLALGASSLVGGATPARGQLAPGDICGPIAETLVIVQNSRLVCDVQCVNVARVSPCIQFGRPNIKLSLNGFTLTGPANPPNITDCAPLPSEPGAFPPADGINVTSPFTPPGGSPIQIDDVVVEGPGMVQRMRRHGIALVGTRRTVVKKLVSHQNCYSGVFMGGTNDSLIEEVVSVRNSAASRDLPCGGVCITNSNGNRIRRSEFAGTGSTAPGPPKPPVSPLLCPVAAPAPNDFGVGLVGSSTRNIIEENGMGGNINGLFICPNAQGNLIQKNVIAGNPPIQVSASPGVDPVPDPVGADVRDFSPAGSNTFKENLCITYTGPTPSACLRPAVGSPGQVPNLPQFAGHQNN